MNNQDSENSFLKNVKLSLDQSEENIPAEALSRLQGIRREAINSQKKQNRWSIKWAPVPYAAWATAALILLVVLLSFPGDREQAPFNQFDDLEILASNNLDFYEELDFYAWLAEEDSNAG